MLITLLIHLNIIKKEHGLFPHITRACQGGIFTSLELVKALVEKTQTKTGLSVAVNIFNKAIRLG
ncbi:MULTISPECIES: ISAzo13-like element transposase-related protein [unclassified Microcoleus]|uniref:ISAzo13-like element transposase-related protein n=1 Tax=unclassified Microcoleus TaxID=2642155 RepID=UPI002FCF68C9